MPWRGVDAVTVLTQLLSVSLNSDLQVLATEQCREPCGVDDNVPFPFHQTFKLFAWSLTAQSFAYPE
jgi:hypothetical protein